MNIEERFITLPAREDAPATEIYIQSITQGKLGERNTALLVPGGPGGNHTVYNSIKEKFFDYADLILFDPRGCGKSQAADVEDCTLEKNIQDIDAIRKILNLDTFILLGGSYGSMVVVGYAAHFSDNLKQLILIAGAPSYHFLDTAKKNLKRLGSDEQIQWGEKLWSGSFHNAEELGEYYKIMTPLYSHYLRDNPQISPPTTQAKIPYNYKLANYAYSLNFYSFDFRDKLHHIKCPTLIIGGDRDWINDPVHIKEMAEKIPHAQLCMLENCGHYFWVDQPEQFCDCLKKHFIPSITDKFNQ